MQKRIFLIALFLLTNLCFAEEVTAINISGNSRVTEKTIKGLLGVEIGQDLTSDGLNAIFKKLRNSKLFSMVALDLTSGTLKVTLKENPILRDVHVSGNKLLSTSVIDKILAVKKDTIFDSQEFEGNIFALKNYYKHSIKEGTTIRYEVIRVDDKRVDVQVKIREARPVVIQAVEFMGNEKYSDRALKYVIKSREKSIFRLFGSSHYYSKEKVELDKALLADFYKSNGYFDYELKSIDVVNKENGVVLEFKISEGVRYRFGKVSVVSSRDGIDGNDFSEDIKIKEGSIFSVDVIRKNALKLINTLNDKGDMFVNVVPEYEPDANGNVNVTYRIIAAKKFKVRKINITGNIRTKDDVIRREILISENDLYTQSKVADSRRRILSLGFFDDVEIEESRLDEQNLDLEVKVKEHATGYINLSGGYGSDVGLFGNFAFTEGNLFGRSDFLKIELQKASSGSSYSAEFQRKRIFDTLITAGASIFFKERDGQGNRMYNLSSKGIEGNLGYYLKDDLYLSTGYSLSSDTIFDVDKSASESIKKSAGTKILSAVGYSVFLNKLDNYAVPKDGYALRFGNKLAGVGGNVNFLRSDFKIGGFTSIFGQRAVVNLIIKGGYIFGYGGQGVDIAHRFFASDMRGFDSEGIGPRDITTKDALGGQLFALGTVEVQTPLMLPIELDLKAAAFYEVGGVTSVDSTVKNVYDSHALRSSVGAGLIWNSPFGMLRVDFAKALVKSELDKVATVKFSIVSPF